MSVCWIENLVTGKKNKLYLTDQQELALNNGEGLENVLDKADLLHLFNFEDFERFSSFDKKMGLYSKIIKDYFDEYFGIDIRNAITEHKELKGFINNISGMVEEKRARNVGDNIFAFEENERDTLVAGLEHYCDFYIKNFEERGEDYVEDVLLVPQAVEMMQKLNTKNQYSETINYYVNEYNNIVDSIHDNIDYQDLLHIDVKKYKHINKINTPNNQQKIK